MINKKNILYRDCSVCGHSLIIFLGNRKMIPPAIFYGGRLIIEGTDFGEYWECAICADNDNAWRLDNYEHQ